MPEVWECPFCGSNKISVFEAEGAFFGIECLQCGACGPTFDTEDEAKKHWTTRANLCIRCMVSRAMRRGVISL